MRREDAHGRESASREKEYREWSTACGYAPRIPLADLVTDKPKEGWETGRLT